MGLLQRMKDDLRAGIATLRLGTVHAAGRALEETELLRIRLELRKLDHQLSDLYKDIGERAVDIKGRGETAERVEGRAEGVQVPNARLGLAQNLGGPGSVCAITVLGLPE